MRRLILPACLLLFALSPASRADFPGPECCSTYPIYTCQPGFLGYPAPPRELASSFENCTGCNHGRGCGSSAFACGRITPNPYSCCFYGRTISNYGLITPVGSIINGGVPGRLPGQLPPGEKLPAPAAR
jgi:hypothetical protein